MISISSLLSREKVLLEIGSLNAASALDAVAGLLRSDPCVLRWESLLGGLRDAAPCAADPTCGFGVCISHARGSSVRGMVMSAGRSSEGVVFPQCALPVRYIFCIGLPPELNADYLRVVGLLTRILKNPETEGKLRRAETVQRFVSTLGELERSF